MEIIVASCVGEFGDNGGFEGSLMMISAIVFGSIAVAAALGVVLMRNPLFSAFSLVVNLLSVAAVYASLDAHFLAVSQVVVYAGAIMVLVLFVLMLLNLKNESEAPRGWLKMTVASCGALLLFTSILPVVLPAVEMLYRDSVGGEGYLVEGSVLAIGRLLYSEYVPQFELSSLVLLVGVVGAVMLTRKQSSDPSPREGGLLGGGRS
jgi:NADH:ubiquinone oxidoreductase subunit 6 (subunit J)